MTPRPKALTRSDVISDPLHVSLAGGRRALLYSIWSYDVRFYCREAEQDVMAGSLKRKQPSDSPLIEVFVQTSPVLSGCTTSLCQASKTFAR